MTDTNIITDVERGLETPPTTTGDGAQIGKTQQATQSATSTKAPDIFDFARSRLGQIKQQIVTIESAHAKPGWKLSYVTVDDFYFPLEGTNPATNDPFDVSISAMVTYEKIEKDMDQGINYSWARHDYNFGELIYPNQISGRKPVMSSKMLLEQDQEVKRRLTEENKHQANKQLLGVDDPEADSQRTAEIVEELRETTKELIKRAETEEDFSQALSNISLLQLHGDDAVDLTNELKQSYDKKRDWIRQAAADRPNSVINKQRYFRNQVIEQGLGIGDTELQGVPRLYTDEEKSAIGDKARQKARDQAPPGFQLNTCEVKFNETEVYKYVETSMMPIEVEVIATYEGIDARGLAVSETVSWIDSPKVLLDYPNANRRPIQKVRATD